MKPLCLQPAFCIGLPEATRCNGQAEREDIDTMQKENNIFFADGKDVGKAEGRAEGRSEGQREILNLLRSVDPNAFEKVTAQLEASKPAVSGK